MYELILTTLLEQFDSADLRTVHREVILHKNALYARRSVERFLHQQLGQTDTPQTLYFIFDEFDPVYRALPSPAIANLRALRDRYKYKLAYILFTRDTLERLNRFAEASAERASETEGFRELFSRSRLGLGPFTSADSTTMIQQLLLRKEGQLSADLIPFLHEQSGGHPGTLLAIYDVLNQSADLATLTPAEMAQRLLDDPRPTEECYKIWQGLAEDEQKGLQQIAQGYYDIPTEIAQLLHLKGLIITDQHNSPALFSPIFAQFVTNIAPNENSALEVNEERHEVFIGNRPILDLTNKEFTLLCHLYHHEGTVIGREEILETLYPEEKYPDPKDNRIDNTIRHLRQKLEADPSHPRYLETVRGRGFKLHRQPITYLKSAE